VYLGLAKSAQIEFWIKMADGRNMCFTEREIRVGLLFVKTLSGVWCVYTDRITIGHGDNCRGERCNNNFK